MKNKLFLIILFTLISCKSSFTSPELKKHFSEKEIEDLEKIVSFYKNQLSKNGSENFEETFNFTLNDFMYSTYRDNFYNLDFNKQKELYSSISDDTFNEIWVYNRRFYYNDKSKVFRSVGFKYDSKYNKFLREVALRNEFIKEYTNLLEGAGAFDEVNFLTYTILNTKINLI